MDDWIQIEGVTPSAEIRRDMAGQKALLAFSRGKDSIAAWLAMRDDGIEVLPFYRYQVPRLRFVAESLAWFEDHFQTEILRIPHVSLWRQIDNYTMQSPERCRVIDSAGISVPSYRQGNDMVCDHFGVDPEAIWVCDGVRASDTPDRRRAISMHGPINNNERQIHIVWDWRARHVWGSMERAKIPKPRDYPLFKRSLDGLDYRYLKALRLNGYEDDVQRILEWFPLLDMEFMRRDHLSRTHPKLPRITNAVV